MLAVCRAGSKVTEVLAQYAGLSHRPSMTKSGLITHLTSFTIATPGPAVQGKARCERHLRSCNEARKRSLDRKRLRVVAWAE
jgi:hypothetical protein